MRPDEHFSPFVGKRGAGDHDGGGGEEDRGHVGGECRVLGRLVVEFCLQLLNDLDDLIDTADKKNDETVENWKWVSRVGACFSRGPLDLSQGQTVVPPTTSQESGRGHLQALARHREESAQN
jgi:hypothetical protein